MIKKFEDLCEVVRRHGWYGPIVMINKSLKMCDYYWLMAILRFKPPRNDNEKSDDRSID